MCIIGAGAAGIYLATRLASKGRSVILLEAGDKTCTNALSVGIETVLSGGPYKGATEGRAFGLGGTTSLWGGLLFPHTSHDYRVGPDEIFDPWRHIVAVVKRCSIEVVKTLGIIMQGDPFAVASKYFGATVDLLQQRGFDVGTAEFLPFRKRNLVYLLSGIKKSSGKVTIYLNAVAVSWKTEMVEAKRARLHSVGAKATDRHIEVIAEEFVIAAGAIESARMLLEIQRQSPANPFSVDIAIGKCLSDHLSCSIAKVERNDWTKAAELFCPRFFRGQMRSFRFVERLRPPNLPRYFAHFIFENENPGFNLARKVIAGVQSRANPSVSFAEVSAGFSGLLLLVWYRWGKSRLYLAKDTPVHLQLDIEQLPDSRNRISLGDELDSSGRPKAILAWDIRPKDLENIHLAASRVLQGWPSNTEVVSRLIPLMVDGVNHRPHDVDHPVGTCRLGIDKEAVVDPDLKVYGVNNLSVLSTAVFPTAGTANPTFSMLCLGEALADRLAFELSG